MVEAVKHVETIGAAAKDPGSTPGASTNFASQARNRSNYPALKTWLGWIMSGVYRGGALLSEQSENYRMLGNRKLPTAPRRVHGSTLGNGESSNKKRNP